MLATTRSASVGFAPSRCGPRAWDSHRGGPRAVAWTCGGRRGSWGAHHVEEDGVGVGRDALVEAGSVVLDQLVHLAVSHGVSSAPWAKILSLLGSPWPSAPPSR